MGWEWFEAMVAATSSSKVREDHMQVSIIFKETQTQTKPKKPF